MKGSEYVLNALVTEGIDHVFFVPGGLIDPFLPALATTKKIKPIVAAQEGGAAYMADGYARASGRFGACLAIGGPGITNMTTAVSAAMSDGSPVLVMSGEVATRMEGRGQFQDASVAAIDDVDVFKPLTATSMSIENPQLLRHHFHSALVNMLGLPHRPVHVSLPQDVINAEIKEPFEPLDRAAFVRRMVDVEAADRLWEHLGHRIAILAGAGVEHANAAEQLKAVAERFDIPVATTLRAKGVFPEDHPLSLGVFGYAGTRHATEALLSKDLDHLFVLGSSLNERDSMHWSSKLKPKYGVVHVDVSVSSLGNAFHTGTIPVAGDAGAFLNYLLDANNERIAALEEGRDERRAWMEAVTKKPRLYDEENCTSDAVPIHPARVIADLRKTMPRDTVLLIDSGAHRAFASHYWQSFDARHVISATNLGPMGWAIPASIGAKCARPDLPCVTVTGDGCMLMHGMEIQTAARYNIAVIYVVINNAALGNVWLRAHEVGDGPGKLTELPDHDWAGFATSLGVKAETVTQPKDLTQAFTRALDAKGPYLIDVKADKHYATPVEAYKEATAAWSYHE